MRSIVICGLGESKIVFYSISLTVWFRKNKLWDVKCVFSLSLQCLSETFLILRRTERDVIKNIHRSSCKVLVILFRFNETWIFLTDFRKNSNTKFHKNPSSGSRAVSFRQNKWTNEGTEKHTKRHDKANSHFSHICDGA